MIRPSERDWELAAVACREVAELPDRDSCEHMTPDDMLVTGDELQPIVAALLAEAREEGRLSAISRPETLNFINGVLLEAEHQIDRWGAAHDRGKSAENWYWLVGYLAGKALRATIEGDRDKALHHTISAAAALSHWHTAISADTGTGKGDDRDLEEIARFARAGGGG